MKKSRADQALETKSRILGSAIELLRVEGVNGLTSGKLSKKLNMSKGTLFHHFGSMEELHVAVLDVIIDSSAQEIDSAEFSSIEKFIEVIVEALFNDMERYRVEYAALFSFLGSAESNEIYRIKIKGMLEAAIERWAELLTKKLDEDIAEEKLYEIVRLLDAHFVGMIAHTLIFQDYELYKKLTKNLLNMIFNDLD